MLNIRSALLLTVSMGIGTAALAERQWPETTYACQVITHSEAQGLVSMQSLSLQDAESTRLLKLGNPSLLEDGRRALRERLLRSVVLMPKHSPGEAARKARDTYT